MRRKDPKERIQMWGIQRLVFFTPRLEQDKGKILLATVLEEESKIYTLSIVIVWVLKIPVHRGLLKSLKSSSLF